MSFLRFAAGFAILATCVPSLGCAPTERYHTNGNVEPKPRAQEGALGPCGMGTSVTRLQARGSNQRSVEGFGSFRCPAGETSGPR